MEFTGNTTGSVPGHRHRRPTRHAAAGALAVALLLTGCSGDGGGDDDAGGTGGKGPAPTAGTGGDSGGSTGGGSGGGTGGGTGPTEAAVLTGDRVAAVLPREGDLPGWGGSRGAPRAIDLRKEESMPVSCLGRKDPLCVGALFTGSTLFTHREAGTITVSVYAYDSAPAAVTASRPLLDRYAEANLLPGDIADSPLPGQVGDSSRAKRGRNKLRSQGSVVVSTVGTTVLIVETGGLNAKIYTGAELVALGEVVAERARQAQSGETPSAKLKDGALDYRRLGTS
jgi:hypothetical protein